MAFFIHSAGHKNIEMSKSYDSYCLSHNNFHDHSDAVALTNLMVERNLPESENSSEELVSVLIPARNEENNIGNILTDLINQDHRNIEVIVFNDQSEDRTAEIVREFARIDNRIRLIESDGLPEGWLGKNYACHKLSQSATGKYLLFLDADVRVGNKLH